ncbi:hypothetical protein Tco_0719736, partial [Tanacetum coccineum]
MNNIASCIQEDSDSESGVGARSGLKDNENED